MPGLGNLLVHSSCATSRIFMHNGLGRVFFFPRVVVTTIRSSSSLTRQMFVCWRCCLMVHHVAVFSWLMILRYCCLPNKLHNHGYMMNHNVSQSSPCFCEFEISSLDYDQVPCVRRQIWMSGSQGLRNFR